MKPEIVDAEMEGEVGLQLERYRAIRLVVLRQVEGRIGDKRHTVQHEWLSFLEQKFGPAADNE